MSTNLQNTVQQRRMIILLVLWLLPRSCSSIPLVVVGQGQAPLTSTWSSLIGPRHRLLYRSRRAAFLRHVCRLTTLIWCFALRGLFIEQAILSWENA